ncbi:DUF3298 and DUF4163 domain-containing protein [Paraclostridium bifermentans]|uniref:DUF3298 and DUF4163 domain-containing protein n=1 Tax=Paraclostridium bifermentans TaxID=1490 RepID=UPI00359C9289
MFVINKFRKIIFISFIMIFISTFLVCASSKDNSCLVITDKKIQSESEFLKVNIKYPVLSLKETCKNDVASDNIEKINKDIASTINDFKNNVEVASKEYEKNKDNTGMKYQYEAFADYNYIYNKDNIVSIPITMYEFTGGAHGFTTLKSFNYDIKNGVEIKLGDLFSEDCNYTEIINGYIAKEISKDKSIYFTGEEGFKGISDNQNFYIEEDGVVVYFGLYEIAPYSSGIPKFKISWDLFDECSKK